MCIKPLEITDDMRMSRKEHVDKIIGRVNESIKRAVENGYHECYFNCGKDNYEDAPFYDEVRARFEQSGYTIKPTGYIDGVWQRTENITW